MELIKSLIEVNSSITLSPIYESEMSLSGEKVKILKLYGTAVVCEKPGINGRAYPLKIMKREADKYTKKYIKNGQGKDYSVFEINLSKVCCLIEELTFSGNKMLIKLRVIDKHPCGQMLKALVDAGLRPGVSLRGAGSVEKNMYGIWEITDDYRLITVDVVGNPSFDEDAVMNSLYESIKNGNVQILTEAVDVASQQFVKNSERNNIYSSRKTLNKSSLIHLLESYSKDNTGILI